MDEITTPLESPRYEEFYALKVNGMIASIGFLSEREATHALNQLTETDKADATIVKVDKDGAELLLG